jgi:hypothetical protein
MQKSKMRAAGSSTVLNGETFQLECSLKRTSHSDQKTFDLVGELRVIATDGSLPADVDVSHLAFKPGWKGWPGYYVLNFTREDGQWRFVGSALNDRHLNFSAVTRRESDRITIPFTWTGLGGSMSEKPEHFATYDVSVTLSDSQRKTVILTKPGVPTD